MSHSLHALRIDKALSIIRASGARSVLDLGCGSGSLLAQLLEDPQLDKIVGIDISQEKLVAARQRLEKNLKTEPDRLQLYQLSYTSKDSLLLGFDAATMIETLEHSKPAELSRLEGAVFSFYRPGIVIVTTPNLEYNVLYGNQVGELRRSDHFFEWGRKKFKKWAEGVARRNRYTVTVSGIGPMHARVGAPSHLAVFSTIQ